MAELRASIDAAIEERSPYRAGTVEDHLWRVHNVRWQYDGNPCGPSEVGIHNQLHWSDCGHDRTDLSALEPKKDEFDDN